MIDLHLSAFAPRWRFLYVVRIDAYIIQCSSLNNSSLSGVTSCKYLNNAKTPSREITRWRFLTKHVSYVNT